VTYQHRVEFSYSKYACHSNPWQIREMGEEAGDIADQQA
jgi:hypothetical protein